MWSNLLDSRIYRRLGLTIIRGRSIINRVEQRGVVIYATTTLGVDRRLMNRRHGLALRRSVSLRMKFRLAGAKRNGTWNVHCVMRVITMLHKEARPGVLRTNTTQNRQKPLLNWTSKEWV